MEKAVEPQIIALVGYPAAGKSTVSQILQEKFGFHWVRTRNIVASLGADGSLAGLQKRGLSLSEGEGAHAFFAELARQVGATRHTVIDAVRPTEHWRLIRDRYPSAILVAVETTRSLRSTRLDQRDGPGLLASRDNHPVEKEVPDLIAQAHYVIRNIDDLQFRVEQMLLYAFRGAVRSPVQLLRSSVDKRPELGGIVRSLECP